MMWERVDVHGLSTRDIAILNAIADRFRQAQGTVVQVRGLIPDEVLAEAQLEPPAADESWP